MDGHSTPAIAIQPIRVHPFPRGLVTLLLISIVLSGCQAGGGGGAGIPVSDIAQLDVVVAFDQEEYCIEDDMEIAASVTNLTEVMMEGQTLDGGQTVTAVDWLITQTQPRGGIVRAPATTDVAVSHTDTFKAGDSVGTGQASARVELIVQDDNGQNRTIVGSGEAESKSFEVTQCVRVTLTYAGLYVDEGGNVTETAKMAQVGLTGPPEGPYNGKGTLELEVRRDYVSSSGECHSDPPWTTTSAIEITAELDESAQVLIFNFNFQPGVADNGVMVCEVGGQTIVAPQPPPGVYDPGVWGLVNVEVPLDGGTKVVQVKEGFLGAAGDGRVQVTFH